MNSKLGYTLIALTIISLIFWTSKTNEHIEEVSKNNKPDLFVKTNKLEDKSTELKIDNEEENKALQEVLLKLFGLSNSKIPGKTWIIPQSEIEKGVNFGLLGNDILSFAHSEQFWKSADFLHGNIYSYYSHPTIEGSIIVMPQLKKNVVMSGTLVEILRYAETLGSPFSGDNLLVGRAGNRASINFLRSLVHDDPPNEDWAIYVRESFGDTTWTSKKEIRSGIKLSSFKSRYDFLQGKDLLLFIHLFGHGIHRSNSKWSSELVLPNHQVKNKSFTGLTKDSTLSVEEIIHDILEEGLSSPDFITKMPGLENVDIQLLEKMDREALSINKLNKSRIRIIIVMEACSENFNTKENTTGQITKTSKSKISELKSHIKSTWEVTIKKRFGLNVDLDLFILSLSEPGTSLALNEDYMHYQELGKVADIPFIGVLDPITGKLNQIKPGKFGVVSPRILSFIEDSIISSTIHLKRAYTFRDMIRDIQFYKDRYLVRKNIKGITRLQDDVSSSNKEKAYYYAQYWNVLNNWHKMVSVDKDDFIIVENSIAAWYIKFPNGSDPGQSVYETEITGWQSAVKLR